MRQTDSKTRSLGFESSEPRLCFSGIVFIEHILVQVVGDVSGDGIVVADVNGDGERDIVFLATSFDAGESQINWIENLGGASFSAARPVTATKEASFDTLRIEDLDADGHADIISVRGEIGKPPEIVWFKNKGATAGFSNGAPIATVRNSVFDVADFDLDGDIDLVVYELSGAIAWHENKGNGLFVPRAIESTPPFTDLLLATDIDGDTDNDFVLIGPSSQLVWYENVVGSNFEKRHEIADLALSVVSLQASDIDGDGDSDLVSATGFSPVGPNIFGSIAWHENVNGDGTFWNAHSIHEEGVDYAHVEDIDGDGDLDVISSSVLHALAWHDNSLETSDFASALRVSEADERNLGRVSAADLDGDGDTDLFSSFHKFDGSDRVPTFFVNWYESRLIGDTNNDGTVNFDDFLALSANFGKQADALWAEGDFDANGTVDFVDFLRLAQNSS